MKFINSLFFSCIAILLILSFTTCAERDNENDPLSALFNMSATITSNSGTTITGNEPLTVTFSDPVTRTSISVGGTMANKAKAVVPADWISDTQLTISPTTVWDSGSGTLTVSCTHLSGTGSVSGSASFTVEHVVYVYGTNGVDNVTCGTKGSPCKKIQYGITRANTLYGNPSTVRVAKGTLPYTSDSLPTSTGSPVVSMVQGISIYGGYNPANWTQDTVNYETIIEDTSTSGGSLTIPNRAVTISSGITSATIIDGFTINIGKGTHSAAIFCEGSPTIQNNKIIGRSSSGDAGSNEYGIINYNTTSSPTISYNSINAGWSTVKSYGIYNNTDSNPIIEHNNINGGYGASTCAIYNSNADYSPYPRIRNANVLDSGRGTINYCIYIYNSRPVVNGNEFTASISANNTYGIFEEADSNCDPQEVKNNNFNFNWGYWYRDDNGTPSVDYSNWDTIGNEISTFDGDELLLSSAWGNYSIY